MDILYQLEELQRRGLLETDENGPDLSTIVVADYLDPHLAEVNRRALADGRPWMPARPRGAVVWAGPVFVPGDGPCWECMAAQLRAVRAAWRMPEQHAGGDAGETRIGVELAALEAERWKRQPDSPARILTFDTRSLVQQSHAIRRRRDCAACGDPHVRRSFTPPILQSRTKAFTFDGGHRAVPPEETYARYEPLVDPLTGIVHHVERAPADSGALNVFVARHNFTIGAQTRPGRSFGKGATAAQARTGALCEALERYSGMLRGDEPLVRAAFRDLGDDDAVHPYASLCISERQYRERNEWNAAVPRPLAIPEEFDETREIDWAPAWSLTHERRRHVAAALCYYADGHNAFVHTDSNGAAAGTCLEDAVLQGLLELIERDAAGIWWYGRHRRPAIETETPWVESMKREHAARGRRLWLLDLTVDIGIPVCAAISLGPDAESLLLGFGAHLDPALAVTRAITEANQLLAVRRAGRVYGAARTDWSFLEPHGSRALSTVVPPSDDLRRDVLSCVGVLRNHGLETLVVDQTRDDVGLPVVRVIVPGLRHFRPRFAPGRLYDVPLRLGWIDRPLCEEDLNPAHITA